MRNQRFQQVVTRVRSSFDGFTAGQRAVTIIALVIALVGGVFFFQWASKPQMTTAWPNLSQTDASSISAKLDEMGVPYELSGTTISVPREQVDRVRIDLAAAGLPAGNNANEGYPLVENAPLTTSDSQQRILVKRATEGELKKAIQQIDTVQNATVNLALPDPDVFTRDQATTKASVVVTPKPNQTLASGQVEAIVHLVSSSIPKLDPSNVTVADSTGALLSAQGAGGGGAVGEARVAQQAAQSAQISGQLQALLDRTVGPGNSSVSVRCRAAVATSSLYITTRLRPPSLAA